MEQSGFLYKSKPEDYILGSTSPLLQGDVINEAGDWILWRPSDEKQSTLKIDTMSCTTFSALNDLETILNFFKDQLNMFSKDQLDWLSLVKFIENNKFNFSDRFTAIMSGTMPEGNYFQNVWDSIRKDGVIPEVQFPIGDPKTWSEYHDKTKITPEMKKLGVDFLERIIEKGDDGKYKINYEFIPLDVNGFNLSEAFKRSPIQVAVTGENPKHAILLVRMDKEFETYKPFLRDRNRTIAYALKISVVIKTTPVVPVYKYFKMTEKTDSEGKHTFGELNGTFRALLDKMRGESGFPWIISSGYRNKEENDATPDSASDSAHVSRMAADIFCSDSGKRDKIVDVAKANGIKRIGIGKNFVHLDIDPTKPSPVMWHYYK